MTSLSVLYRMKKFQVFGRILTPKSIKDSPSVTLNTTDWLLSITFAIIRPVVSLRPISLLYHNGAVLLDPAISLKILPYAFQFGINRVPTKNRFRFSFAYSAVTMFLSFMGIFIFLNKCHRSTIQYTLQHPSFLQRHYKACPNNAREEANKPSPDMHNNFVYYVESIKSCHCCCRFWTKICGAS
ncbi:hypothetical protein EGR_03075 [Echinococcus granulosus]|uniref:Uncharacterized protein n=1 Tax=Echinococcus granulosus TaxID=6210 RepID=W6V6M7_ECHGR|nr:hypothetical protein EGR_03075 [Echinococcus granulosus]EUB62054.1 hypothetical protein EGR_03075 [Echinococcus granulosus]